MERPVVKAIGTPVGELDTPALVVDLGRMEQNIEALHSLFRDGSVGVRPDVSQHKCPAIAHAQLSSGGTVGGISVSGVGEAEEFAAAGFSDILVASEIVTRSKIARLCSLARRSSISIAVDNLGNVGDLSEVALAGGVTLDVLVDIDTGGGTSGVAPGRPALDLAKEVARAGGLRFAGLMRQADAVPEDGPDERLTGISQAVQPLLETRELLETEGIVVSSVSVGATYDYDFEAITEGVTEVRAGSYPLMDYNGCRSLGRFLPAAMVLATVVSHSAPDYAVIDSGHKAIPHDRGLPVVEGMAGVRMIRLSAEHGALELDAEAQDRLDVGVKVRLIPMDLGTCVNQYDYIHAVRDGKLEAVWEISARGRLD